MKQIIQDLRHGDTILEEIPAPLPKKGHLLISTHRSLVSLGTCCCIAKSPRRFSNCNISYSLSRIKFDETITGK